MPQKPAGVRPTRNLRAFLMLILLGVVAAAGWWSQDAIRPKPATTDDQSFEGPDSYLNEFTAITMNDQGVPRYRLVGASMKHFPDDDRAEIDAPRLVFFRDDGAPVHVRAESGTVRDAGELVILHGAVHIDRPGSPNNRPTQLTTRDLRVHPERSYAETEAHALIRSVATTLEGVGMQAWIAEGRLKLLSQVRGTHEPTD